MKARYAAYVAFATASLIIATGSAIVITSITQHSDKGFATIVHPGTSQSASGQPAMEPPPSPVGKDDSIAEIGDEGFTYDNGLQVQVISAKPFQPSATAAGARPGQIGVKIQIRMTNDSTKTVDLSRTRVRLASGPNGVPAERVLDSNALLTDFVDELAPGRNATATFGFAVDQEGAGQLIVEVRPGNEYDSCQFSGAA